MGVTFLVPGLLAGFLVVGIPIIVHLISRRRARKVPFAAIEFVLKSQKRTARSVRLRQFLLLLIRTLLVAAVAAAVARPVLRSTEENPEGEIERALMVVVDVSASMRARLGGDTGFEIAAKRAGKSIAEADDDTLVGLLACGADTTVPPTFDRRRVLDALAGLKVGFGASRLGECVGRAAELAGTVEGEGRRRVVVLSDLAAHAFEGGGAGSGPGLFIEWRRVFEDVVPNHGISSVSADFEGVESEDHLALSFSVARYGGVALEVPADLYVDDKRAARLTLELDDQSQVERKFSHRFPEDRGDGPVEEDHRARIQLGDDALSEDNVVELPVHLPRPVRVVVIDGAPQPIPFRDEVFYLENALRHDKAGAARLDVEVIGADALNASVLADARVVYLANVARLEAPAVRALLEFVEAGGGVFISVGDEIDVEWWNENLGTIVPGRLRGAKGQALLDDASVAEVLGLTRFAAGHPAFLGLAAGKEGGLTGLAHVETQTYMLLEPDPDAPRDVIAHFTNQVPALLERRVGAGRVLLLATSIDRDWSDLAIRPGFLPFVQKSTLYLANALSQEGAAFLAAGEPRTLLPPRGIAHLEVHAPDGEITRIDVEGGGAESTEPPAPVRFEGTAVPGLYRVFGQRDGGEMHELVRSRFSVLFPAAESNLLPADDSLLAEATPIGARQHKGDEDDESPLWPLLLLAAIGLFALESVALRRQ